MIEFYITSMTPQNRELVQQLFIERWGSVLMLSKGQMHAFSSLKGFIAKQEDQVVGVVTFKENDQDIELISLDSWVEKRGIGSALLQQVVAYACTLGGKRLWLVTTNDNLYALKFYQNRRWKIVAVHLFAVKRARLLKPEIPESGYAGIPILHEIELEYPL